MKETKWICKQWERKDTMSRDYNDGDQRTLLCACCQVAIKFLSYERYVRSRFPLNADFLSANLSLCLLYSATMAHSEDLWHPKMWCVALSPHSHGSKLFFHDTELIMPCKHSGPLLLVPDGESQSSLNKSGEDSASYSRYYSSSHTNFLSLHQLKLGHNPGKIRTIEQIIFISLRIASYT